MPGAFPTSEALLEAALEAMERRGVRIAARSSWWRSDAWPDPAGPEYRNGVVLVETSLDSRELLGVLRSIESDFGRRRAESNASRTLDLDLIAYGREQCEAEGLTIPHPRAADRLFVMGPLSEVLPDWRHPVLRRTARALAREAPFGRDAAPAALQNR